MEKILIMLILVTLSGCSSSTTSESYSERFERHNWPSGSLWIDKETGCQYLKGNSFTPVLTAEGKPYCVR